MRVVLKDGSAREVPDRTAGIIARSLSGSYPGTTAEMVAEQLNKNPAEHDIIGMFAYGQLETAGLIPDL